MPRLRYSGCRPSHRNKDDTRTTTPARISHVRRWSAMDRADGGCWRSDRIFHLLLISMIQESLTSHVLRMNNEPISVGGLFIRRSDSIRTSWYLARRRYSLWGGCFMKIYFFVLYLCKRYLYVGEKCILDDLFRLEMFILEIVCNSIHFFFFCKWWI